MREALINFAHDGLRHHTDKTRVVITAYDADGEAWDLATIFMADLRHAAKTIEETK